MSAGRLLVLDYPGRRDEARIAELRLEDAGWDVEYLIENPVPQDVSCTGYARSLAQRRSTDGTDGTDGTVDAVLAYCSAAPIAQDLGHLIAADGNRPALVFFDGEPSPPVNLRRDAIAAAVQLGGRLPEAALELIMDGTVATDPARCVDALRTALVGLASDALRDDGADDAEVAATAPGIAGFYLDWLVFLVAALNTDWPAWPGEIVHVTSRRHGYPGDWPGAALTRVIRVDRDRDELLHTAECRAVALDVLAQVAQTAPLTCT